jgi:hypothetical protein
MVYLFLIIFFIFSANLIGFAKLRFNLTCYGSPGLQVGLGSIYNLVPLKFNSFYVVPLEVSVSERGNLHFNIDQTTTRNIMDNKRSEF